MNATGAADRESALFGRTCGDGSETLVFLHGFGGCHAVWDHIASVFSATHRTIAYDLPGHGRSLDASGPGKARAAALAILADLSERGIAAAHFVGHSMGGAVAALAAIADPACVASLTLLAPGGFGPEINGTVLRRYAAATSQSEIRSCLGAMSGPDARFGDAVVAELAAMRAEPRQTELLERIAADISRDDRQGVIPTPMLAGLTMPVTVMWGTRDPILPYGQTASLPPHFALLSLEGAGHMLAEEAPDRVLAAIRDTIA